MQNSKNFSRRPGLKNQGTTVWEHSTSRAREIHPQNNAQIRPLKTAVKPLAVPQQLSTLQNAFEGAVAMSTQSQCELMTVQQVAELLQVPVSWVYGRLRKRSLEKLPGYRLGKYWRFEKEEVLAWLAEQRE